MTRPARTIDTLKIFGGAAFAVILAAIWLGSDYIRPVRAFAEGPPAGRTGAPGELTCDTSGCHNTLPLNPGDGQFDIFAPPAYEPGQTYQITVQHTTTDLTRRRWGFELTVLTVDNVKAGDLQSTSGLTSILNNQGPGLDRQYIEHNITGTFQGQKRGASWTFNWTAPPSDVGPVTFFAAGNQANGDGTAVGDFIYTASVSVPPVGPPNITGASVSGRRLFVDGANFDNGSLILLNGAEQRTLHNAPDPSTTLIGKKAGRLIAPGSTVMLQVRNSNGALSNVFPFTRTQ